MKPTAVLAFTALSLACSCSKKPAGPLDHVIAITAGKGHACALVDGGRVACWGDNGAGQTGSSPSVFAGRATTERPAWVAGLPPVTRVSAGDSHTCAVDREGAVWCWGSNHFGEIGKPDLSYSAANPTPTRVPGTGRGGVVAREVVAGAEGTCVVAEGRKLACWGSFNELGATSGVMALTGNRGPGMAPDPQILPIQGVNALARSRSHTCAATSHNTTHGLSCWGVAREGQLGRPAPPSCAGGVCRKPEPVEIPSVSPADVEELAAHQVFTCARTKGRDLYCWEHAANALPEAADPKLTAPSIPKGIDRGAAVGVATFGPAVCALDGAGAVRCFGHDPRRPSPEAVVVAEVPGATKIALGAGFGCALAAGQVKCWGAGDLGQLGGGVLVPGGVTSPVAVAAP